ncbi:DUF378 domain-containing protein [Pseudogracilibacillus auburnensis]|uniref:DUF378 domain-containing protein n=1 Tax=Pseudogracilibacillus auburnensis TaxID=1494959 RepID=A0A2V3W018_9BACI|nr:DUF378 domain-containing protein [Pseudogracilibacillus auburnensis]MBO1003480.1 DUF378 domain-containing protein [Pseudogracilibacillus auburnensis]PXW86534.1 hypothetical protein DFR56_10753 [Pseudogracilibacillus auburnensis]
MDVLRRIALALIIIGAINWGLIGFFNFDLVAAIFGGQQSLLSRIIYSLVGLSGLYALTIFFTGMSAASENNIHTDRPNYGTEFGSEFDHLRNKDDSNNEEGN